MCAGPAYAVAAPEGGDSGGRGERFPGCSPGGGGPGVMGEQCAFEPAKGKVHLLPFITAGEGRSGFSNWREVLSPT